MTEQGIRDYITSRNISTYKIATLINMSQPGVYRMLKSRSKMKADVYLKLSKAIENGELINDGNDRSNQFDEKLVMAMEDEVPYQSNNKTIREQAEALKMSSEHIGKLIAQVSMLMEENKELKDQLNKIQKELWESKMHA